MAELGILGGLAVKCRREFPYGYGWHNAGDTVGKASVEEALARISTHRANRILEINRQRVRAALEAGCQVQVLAANQEDGHGQIGHWTTYCAHGIFVSPNGVDWYKLLLAGELTPAGAFEEGAPQEEAGRIDDPLADH